MMLPPAELTDLKLMSASSSHTLALKADGSIVGWGWNEYGQAAPPAGNDFVAIAAGSGSTFSLALRRNAHDAVQLPGDCNQDGGLDLSDGICLLGHLFLGDPAQLPCEGGSPASPGNRRLLNVNGDADVDLSDAITIFTYLYLGTPAPALDAGCGPAEGCPDNSAMCKSP